MPSLPSSAILSSKPLGVGPMPTIDPFLFCVYHKDQYPAGNADMEAPSIGNGSDFNPNVPYRMYHGDRIPGFPSHPHRGFETITATIEGIIDHADSVGNAGRYGMGDVQWMTAGAGVVHSEMFPLLHDNQDNPTRFFQIWLNLPARNKMVEPSFAMFWANEVPKWESDNGNVVVTLWSGALDYFFATTTASSSSSGNEIQNKAQLAPPQPPPNSWAADPNHDVAIWHITLQPGGKLTLPIAKQGSSVNRSLFYIEGGSQDMKVDGQPIDSRVVLQVKADQEIVLEYTPANKKSSTTTRTDDDVATKAGEFLLLQGVPIQEPIAQYGPFVMNSHAEIEQAFRDYQHTKFGGWPWPRDDMVFERTKGRFAILHGKETSPTEDAAADAAAPVCDA